MTTPMTNDTPNTCVALTLSLDLFWEYQEEHADSLEYGDDAQLFAASRYPPQGLKHDDRHSVIQ